LVDVVIRDDCSFVERPVAILDRDVKSTRNSKIELVKVQWSVDPLDASWEVKSSMVNLYPFLFDASSHPSSHVTRSSGTS
jgi:hypothetical protein